MSNFKFSTISFLIAALVGNSQSYASMSDDDERFSRASSATSASKPANDFEKQRGKHPAIFQAVDSGNLAAIKEQLAKGVPVDALDSDMYTPLMKAAFQGKGDVVKLLLEKGADPTMFRGGEANPQTGLGMKAIHSAVNGLSLSTLKLIVDDLKKKGKTKEIALKDGNEMTIFDKISVRKGDNLDQIRKAWNNSDFLKKNAELIQEKQNHIDKAQSFLNKGMNVEQNQKKINDLKNQITDLKRRASEEQRSGAEKTVALKKLEEEGAKIDAVYNYIASLPEFVGTTPLSFHQ